jgi:hypothetical protein
MSTPLLSVATTLAHTPTADLTRDRIAAAANTMMALLDAGAHPNAR